MLLMSLLVLAGILSVSLIASSIVMKGLKMSNVQSGSTKAYYASEAGIERALWEARKGGYSPATDEAPAFSVADLGNKSFYSVDYASNTPYVYFTSVGTYGDTNRSIKVSYKTFECIVDCAGKDCGSNGCGGTCGECGTNQTCSATYQCECDAGYADCDGDGNCDCDLGAGYSCSGGACVSCVPDCSCAASTCVGSTCTDPVCGSTCDGTLTPDCSARECGTSPNGCGSCGTCIGENQECSVSGICECQTGYDDCDGDGNCDCDLSSGSCSGGACVSCTPDCSCSASTCEGSTCTDPVCGSNCAGTLTLVADCSGLSCGTSPHGCGSCGSCSATTCGSYGSDYCNSSDNVVDSRICTSYSCVNNLCQSSNYTDIRIIDDCKSYNPGREYCEDAQCKSCPCDWSGAGGSCYFGATCTANAGSLYKKDISDGCFCYSSRTYINSSCSTQGDCSYFPCRSGYYDAGLGTNFCLPCPSSNCSPPLYVPSCYYSGGIYRVRICEDRSSSFPGCGTVYLWDHVMDCPGTCSGGVCQ